MPVLSSLVKATGTLTFTGAAVDTQTVTIGGKVYTTQTTLTDVNGNVLIGANQAATCLNLSRALSLGAGVGTLYATAMTANSYATGVQSGDTLVVTAKDAGVSGNLIATTETQTNASFGAATLAGGAGNLDTAVAELIAGSQLNSDALQALGAMG
jgi:hypothetical protein